MTIQQVQISDVRSDKLVTKILKAFRLETYNSPTRALIYVTDKMLREEEEKVLKKAAISGDYTYYNNVFNPVSQSILYSNGLDTDDNVYINKNYLKFASNHILTACLSISITPSIDSYLKVNYMFEAGTKQASNIDITIGIGNNGDAYSAMISFDDSQATSGLLFYLMQAGT